MSRPRKELRPEDLTAIVDRMLIADQARLIYLDLRYAITRDGHVFSRAVKGPNFNVGDSWRKLKQGRSGRGKYPCVCLGRKSYQTHRLMALVFMNPRVPGYGVRHIDGDNTNNRLSNLCYGTQKENIGDAIRHQSMCRGSNSPFAKLNAHKVRLIRRRHASGETQTALALEYGIANRTVSVIVRRKAWAWLD